MRLQRERGHVGDAVDDVDPAPVGIAQSHHRSAAGLVEDFDRRADGGGQLSRSARLAAWKARPRNAGSPRWVTCTWWCASVPRMYKARSVRAERCMPKSVEERLHAVQVRGLEAGKGDVADADDRVRHERLRCGA